MFSYINKKIKKFNLDDQSVDPTAIAPANHKERLSSGAPCSSCHSPDVRWDSGNDFLDTEFSLGERIYHKLNLFRGSGFYKKNCAACHGMARQGFIEHELFGDGYAPSLVGITLTSKKDSLRSITNFKRAHKYTSEKVNIRKEDLEEVRNYFSSLDLSLIHI